jgi:hypothetical protein
MTADGELHVPGSVTMGELLADYAARKANLLRERQRPPGTGTCDP